LAKKTTLNIGIDIREAITPNKAGKGEYAFNMISHLINLNKNNSSTELVLFNDSRFIPPKSWQKHTQIIQRSGLAWHKNVAKACHSQNISVYFSPTSYITPFYISQKSPETKTITTVHDLIVYLHPKSHPLKPRLIEKRFLKKLINQPNNTFTTVSESTKADLLQVFPVLDPKKIHTIKNGLKEFPKPTTRSKKRKTKSKPFILSVSTVLPRKNYITLLQAFNIVKSQIPHNLHIIGKYSPQNLNPLQKYINQNQLNSRVKLMGYVTSQKLSSQYQKADILVIPSKYEGFGLPVIEGLKRGLPVICSDIPVFHEVADPAALYFDPNNPIDLANQIIFLSNNAEQKQILKVEGPKLVKKYSWKKSAQKLWKLLIK
jgi:glycosyltransferase involved in cell wall biosynthesis